MAKLNFQNIPARDLTIKQCFKAREDYTIVNCDLQTAEVAVAAILSQDKYLLNVFTSGQDIHSTVAKTARKLECPVEDIKAKYPEQRQLAKSVVFGVMYGSSAYGIYSRLVADGVTTTLDEVELFVDEFWANCYGLKDWFNMLEEEYRATGKLIYANGRLVNNDKVFSTNEKEAESAVRTVLNGAIQGVSSDYLLCGFTDLMNNFILKNDYINQDLVLPFTLVHDSITAEVHDSVLDDYKKALLVNIQQDRWFLPDAPFKIGVDMTNGDSWATAK